MQKKLFCLILALGMIVTGQEVVTSLSHGDLSNLAMENVDALTESEQNELHYKKYPCGEGPGTECVEADNPQEADCAEASYCDGRHFF